MTVPVKIAVRIMKSTASSVTTWRWLLGKRPLKMTRDSRRNPNALTQVHQRLFIDLSTTLQTSGRHFQT